MKKSIWKQKGPRIPKANMKNDNKVGELLLCDFKTFYKATVINNMILTLKSTNQWKRIDPLFLYRKVISTKVQE